VRLFGHPLHPALVHFPMALLAVVPLWDVAALLTGQAALWWGAFGCLVAGLVTGLLAAIPGFVDYVKLPDEGSVARTALWHAAWVLGALALAATSAFVRGGPDPLEGARRWMAVGASGAALGPLLAGGFQGGKLVFIHGVGVQGQRRSSTDG
jgi:uncharacterized membrane protein